MRAVVFGLVLSVPITLMAQPDELPASVRDAFEKSKKAKFSGKRLVTTVRAGKKESHSETVTKFGNKMRIEFSEDSDFAGQIIIEDGSQRFHFFPDRNELRLSPTNGRRQFEMLRLNGRMMNGRATYKLSDGGQIAGFDCQKLSILDQSGNTVANIFFNPTNGLFLKRSLFDPSGAVLASFEFQSVSMNPRIAEGTFKFNRKGVKVIRPIDEVRSHSSALSFPSLMLSPKTKYVLESANRRKIRGNETLVQNYFRDDSRITLFVTKKAIDQDRRPPGGRMMSIYKWQSNGVNLTLIGAVEEEVLRKLSTQVSELPR